MKPKVFIDGEHGTTGLQIRQRVADRKDLDVISLEHADRHDKSKRAEKLNEANVAILCLPDDAAREAVSMLKDAGNKTTRLIDTSTAHRSDDDWAYGFAEMAPGHGAVIAKAQRVSNPGCYSTGAIALIKPLVDAGLLQEDYPLTITGVSGYTGGGKQLIAQMEDADNENPIFENFYQYALALKHKHVPEIVKRCGLSRNPVFSPAVGRFPQGMLVSVPLHVEAMGNGASMAAVSEALNAHYAGQSIVSVIGPDEAMQASSIAPETLSGADTMNLHITGNDVHVNLVAQLDNLGKGASGAAVQNLNLMIGAE